MSHGGGANKYFIYTQSDGGENLLGALYAQRWWRQIKKVNIFPKVKRAHGGGKSKTSLYAQIRKSAWWRGEGKSVICPNEAPSMVEISKCSQNMPARAFIRIETHQQRLYYNLNSVII